jgi:toxin ParE1/3/4
VTAEGPAVLVTLAAAADLADIRAYTEEVWGETQWLAYYGGLLQTFDRIAIHPLSGRSRERFAPGLRSVPFREHVIFYLPLAGGGVAIQRILHGARNAEALRWDQRD